MTVHTIQILNCNNIDQATISIKQDALNIKYGPNGTGKSTIARAILYSKAGGAALGALKPFKHRIPGNTSQPNVIGAEHFDSILVFDEAYVSQFTFQKDEVLKDSFNVFIQNHSYLEALQGIEEQLAGIKSSFQADSDIIKVLDDLKSIRDAFTVTNAGKLAKTSKAYKALSDGNKIENIPDALLPFKSFIKSENPAQWVEWQTRGSAFIEKIDTCPYCATDLSEPTKKEQALSVGKEFEPKKIEHLSKIQTILSRLGNYLEPECKIKADLITKSKVVLSTEEEKYLASISNDADTLIQKLESLYRLSFYSLRDVEVIENELNELKIDLSYIEKFNSEKTKSTISPINQKLDSLLESTGQLKGRINIHKRSIQKAVRDNEGKINSFLKTAGYKYRVEILPEFDSYKMKIVHDDFGQHIESAGQHLSYGEKNAFALVLFMHQVLSAKPSLVILDDPVSSFDKTKKFAILHELFLRSHSLRNITVLMLTHDIEPAIDIIKILPKRFGDPKPCAHYLSSANSTLSEKEILRSDILTFAQICEKNISQPGDPIIKCIYLRRHFEIINEISDEYELLSNLLHGRITPIRKVLGNEIAMTSGEISNSSNSIRVKFAEFDYESLLSLINDRLGLKSRFDNAVSGYDKLQLFRLYKDAHSIPDEPNDSAFQKFVNETFHIENEYIMQLNPREFDNIPLHILNECKRLMDLAP